MKAKYTAENLISELEEQTEQGIWEFGDTVDDGEYIRVEVYTDKVEEQEFHDLGAQIGVNTAVQRESGRYTASWEK